MIKRKPQIYKGSFSTLSNATLRNTDLSPEALRLLIFLLSQSNDYRPSESAIAKRYNVSIRSVSRWVGELKSAGHLLIETFYNDNKSEKVWIVSEFPVHVEKRKTAEPQPP